MIIKSTFRKLLAVALTAAAIVAGGTVTATSAQAATCPPWNKPINMGTQGSYADSADILSSPLPCSPAKGSSNEEQELWQDFTTQLLIARTYAAAIARADTGAKVYRYTPFARHALFQMVLLTASSVSAGGTTKFSAAEYKLMYDTNLKITPVLVERVARVVAYQLSFISLNRKNINKMYDAAEFATGDGYELALKAFSYGTPAGMLIYTTALKKSKGTSIMVLNATTTGKFTQTLENAVG